LSTGRYAARRFPHRNRSEPLEARNWKLKADD
jgi:hypothetical protein